MRLVVSAFLLVLLAGCVHYQPRPVASEAGLEQMESRSLSDPGLREFIAEATGRSERDWPPQVLEFEDLSLVALYFHPSLEVARAQWRVTRASTKTASARLNPTVSAQPGYNLSAASGVNPWIPGVNIDWPLETAGKRGHRIRRALHLSEAARLNILQTAWQVRATLRIALLDLTAARQREVLLQQQIEADKTLNDVLQQRLQAGAVSRLEIVPFQLSYIKASSDLAEAHRLAAEARGRVAEGLGLPLAAIEGSTLRHDLSPSVPPGTELAATVLHRAALQNRSDVRALLAEYAASESAVQLEIAKQYPDIHLGSGYQWDQGDNKWSLALTMELPVLNRNQGPIAEGLARRAEVGTRFTALQARIIADVDRAVVSQRAAQEQVSRTAELLQIHHRQLDALRSALSQGAADQLEVRTAEVEAAAAELVRLDAVVRLQQALGELQQAIQAPLQGSTLLEQSRREPKDTANP